MLRTANGTLGSSTAPTAQLRRVAASPERRATTAAGAISARTSSSGTAYVGTTRRGSQTSIARVLSTTVSPPSVARIRLSIGSCRRTPSSFISTSRRRVLMV